MQELRLVLIIVGLLAIAALLFHGLWTSKKEGKAKFGNKPHRKLESSEEEEQDYTATRAFAPEDDFEIIRKTRKEPEFADNTEKEVPAYDPLVDSEEPLPSFSSIDDDSSKSKENEPIESIREPEAFVAEPQKTEQIAVDQTTDFENEERIEEPVITEPEPEAEKEMEVLVLNVHCAGDDPFVGTSLFDSMKQNGLLYGEMDIFHRHADLSGTGKVLFSVANMMQPGTLQHDDPDTFTTQGISFFMTLPCFGEADQNFKLMLKTAQQIADDLGGNVLDDQRNLMTPDRLDAYRQQIRDFNTG
ncbi:cell division protein ZipA [Vibrio nigripulchritudo]|uniref:cell division protein ZipA n=1 Tax=Vibrio nigripulchritudo TaxID=28173 RepID=UPI0005F9B052|nr:cell division protein ZipA [Vibrio nigripulchritudo]KJY69136.1 cell division protein ZipA [Vibrio nigripulchritudo]